MILADEHCCTERTLEYFISSTGKHCHLSEGLRRAPSGHHRWLLLAPNSAAARLLTHSSTPARLGTRRCCPVPSLGTRRRSLVPLPMPALPPLAASELEPAQQAIAAPHSFKHLAPPSVAPPLPIRKEPNQRRAIPVLFSRDKHCSSSSSSSLFQIRPTEQHLRTSCCLVSMPSTSSAIPFVQFMVSPSVARSPRASSCMAADLHGWPSWSVLLFS